MGTCEVDDYGVTCSAVVATEQLVLDIGVFLAVLGEVNGEVVELALDGAVADRAVFLEFVGVATLATV